MQWLKLQTALRHNKLFKRLSKNAKLAYFGALMAACDYEQHGLLTTREGPLTDAELADDLFLTKRESALAVKELSHLGFLSLSPDGLLAISKWNEKAAPLSTPRVRKHRENQRLETLHETLETLSETLHPVSCNALNETDKEAETEIERDRKRVSDLDPTRARADELADFLLTEGIKAGVIAEHRALDPGAWRVSNREDAIKLVAAYGLDLCKDRALAMFAAQKTGKIRNRGGQYAATMLSRVWEYRELQTAPVATEHQDLLEELRRLG